MNHTLSDAEALDEIERDIRTTLAFLKARTLATYSQIQTIPRMDVHTEWTAKVLDGMLIDLTADAVEALRDKIPTARDYRLDQVGADRAMAAAE